jgi:hypothetical protein
MINAIQTRQSFRTIRYEDEALSIGALWTGRMIIQLSAVAMTASGRVLRSALVTMNSELANKIEVALRLDRCKGLLPRQIRKRTSSL